MTPEEASRKESEYENFFLSLGKALSRLKLYSLAHPMTADSVRDTYQQLETCLSDQSELSIAWTGEELLLNGSPSKTLGGQKEAISGLFERYHLQSISFVSGVSSNEMTSFLKFLTLKEGTIRNAEDLKNFLGNENVQNIKIDTAFYAKVSGDKKDGDGRGAGGAAATAQGAGAGAGSAAGEAGKWLKQLENLPVETMLWKLIEEAVKDPEERKKVFEMILKQLKQELEDYVRKATQRLEQEKQQITNIQERTESVIRNIAEGTIVLDEKGQIVMMNPAAEKIYGASLSEMKGKRLSDSSKDEVLIALAKEITDSASKDFSKEVAVQSGEEAQQVIMGSTAMIQNPEGKIVGIMSLLNDIAKQRELQRMQNDFMAHVTHELRSPLTAIRAALGTMFDEGSAVSPSQQQILTIANRNIERLARLINDLLDCAKIGAGKMTVTVKEMDLAALLKETVLSLESWAKTKGIALSFDEKGTLPKVYGDPDRLTQVVVNLVSNAIKFTPKGGSIRVRAEPTGNYFVRVGVMDTGPGIPKEKQQHLFERFFQLRQTEKMEQPGTGLGLYIAKSIVELHKGQIGMESEEGKGSTFYFTLPMVREARAAAEAAHQEQQQVQVIGQVVRAEKKKGWLAKLFGK